MFKHNHVMVLVQFFGARVCLLELYIGNYGVASMYVNVIILQ